MTDLELAHPAAPGEHRRETARTPNDRWATRAFVAVVVVALPFYLVVSRNVWFNHDDWDYVATRSAGSLRDLFRPHSQHWQTLPILFYRGMWHLFGLDHYQLYVLPVVVLHLTAAVLVWIIIRRVGVRPWIATLVGSMFVLYGAGFQDIIWAFQVGFNAALVLGLAQLLLADHDGGVDRRDYLAIGCGVLGLMCAGLAVTMVFIVGVAMLLRRGWRVAVLQAGPPMAVFAVWWVWMGRDDYGTHSSVTETLHFAWRGITTAFENVGGTSGTAALLLVVLAVGWTLAWSQSGSRERRIGALAVPGAMLVGALVFLAVAGYGRADFLGVDFAERSRYGHIVLALSSPAIAVAVNALTNLRRAAGVVIAALVVAGIPTNLNTAANARFGDPDTTLAMAHAPLARRVPAGNRPDLTDQRLLTVGWLVDNADAGRIPKSNPSPTTAAEATIRLSLQQQLAPIAKAASCVPLGSEPVEGRLAKGQKLQSKGGLLQVALADNGRSVGSVIYRPVVNQDSITLEAVAPIDVRVAAAMKGPTMLCR